MGDKRRFFAASALRFLYIVFIGLLFAACQPVATPFPADGNITNPASPNAPADPIATQGAIRYGLAAKKDELGADFDLIAAGALVEELATAPDPNDLGARFDIIAGFGVWPGAERSPRSLRVTLALNAALPPVDDPAIQAVLRRALDPAALLAASGIANAETAPVDYAPPDELRATLANAGWPDGFEIILAYDPAPGLQAIVEQLRAAGIESRTRPRGDATFENASIHVAVVSWRTPEERALWVERSGSEDLVIDLFALSISYWASPGLELTFSPNGWPIAARR